MKKYKSARIKNNESGAALVEYGLIAALVIMVALPSLALFGLRVANRYCDNSMKVGDASGNAVLLQYTGYYDPLQNKCCKPTPNGWQGHCP